MDKLERILRLHKLFKERRTPVSLAEMCDTFECSESTAKRSIRDLKNYGAPIFCTDGLGYRYDRHTEFELLGTWFSPEELHALLSIQQLTLNLSGGFFDSGFKAICSKVTSLLGVHAPLSEDIQRVRVLGAGSRSKTLPMFSMLAGAVLERKRLHIMYESRQRDEISERDVSPQSLVYYRGNWYLDAWCHQADGFRIFAVEKVQKAHYVSGKCRKFSEKVLAAHFTTSFGIFAGEPIATAILRFSAQAARWVQDEEWFPGLQGQWLDDDRFELQIPYNNSTELIMEICRYGADVEVVEPAELRRKVAAVLQKATEQYM